MKRTLCQTQVIKSDKEDAEKRREEKRWQLSDNVSKTVSITNHFRSLPKVLTTLGLSGDVLCLLQPWGDPTCSKQTRARNNQSFLCEAWGKALTCECCVGLLVSQVSAKATRGAAWFPGNKAPAHLDGSLPGELLTGNSMSKPASCRTLVAALVQRASCTSECKTGGTSCNLVWKSSYTCAHAFRPAVHAPAWPTALTLPNAAFFFFFLFL